MMSKAFAYLFVLILAVFGVSCASDEIALVQGIVVHETTGDPVDNATIKIDLFVDGGLFRRGRIFTKGAYSFLDVLQTDERGAFRLQIKKGSHIMISIIDNNSGRAKIARLLDITQTNYPEVIVTYPNSFKFPIDTPAESTASDADKPQAP